MRSEWCLPAELPQCCKAAQVGGPSTLQPTNCAGMQVNFFAREEHDSLPNYKILQAGLSALNVTKVRLCAAAWTAACSMHDRMQLHARLQAAACMSACCRVHVYMLLHACEHSPRTTRGARDSSVASGCMPAHHSRSPQSQEINLNKLLRSSKADTIELLQFLHKYTQRAWHGGQGTKTAWVVLVPTVCVHTPQHQARGL